MKIVLAYSGGLDTSVVLKWLIDTYDAEVIAFCADLGQLEDLTEVKEKALATGASKVYVEDLKSEFLSNYCFKALRAGAAYQGQYLLAAPLGRPLITKRMVEIAQAEGANVIAHGASGKGNDQVRFYSGAMALDPSIRVLAPVIEWDMKSREDELAYARQHGIALPAIVEGKQYSIDTNIWGSSIECGPLDDISQRPPEEIYQFTVSPEAAPDSPVLVTIGFEEGVPVSVDGQAYDPIPLVQHLNTLGGAHGVGRIDILENRVVGIKTRGAYESPAATLLHAAYRELENLTVDRDTLHYKSGLAPKYAELVYYGLWFSPLRDALDGFVERIQERVTGQITLRLYKGHATIEAREAARGMYNVAFSTYEEGDSFDHRSGEGFAYIWSMPLRIAHGAANNG